MNHCTTSILPPPESKNRRTLIIIHETDKNYHISTLLTFTQILV